MSASCTFMMVCLITGCGDCQMVAFVPPDHFWLHKVAAQYPDHGKMYMPNWSFLKQQTANDVLGLGLSMTDLTH